MAENTGNQDSKILVGLAVDPRETSRLYSQIANIASRVPPIKLKFQNQGVLGTMAKDANEFERSLGAASSRVLSFGATAGVLYSVAAAFTALVKSTIDVEKQLKDINVVFGLSSDSLKSFSKELFIVASQTGQAFSVASKAALEFSRQGLSVEQTLKRTKDALILTRLSGLDVAQSVETITAALNGFNDATLTSTVLINKLATVDAAFAVSTADLAEAFTRVGSTASDAGVSLDSLIGIVTSAQQSTARGGAVIGNSLKTIFQRVTRSQTLESLKQFNIEVEDLQGNVLSADRILINLAKSFKGASVEQQNFITQLAAGVFQSNQFRAILNDLAKESSVYSRALATSSNATDQAAQRNAELNKTLSASIQEIKNRFTELGATFGNLTIKAPIDTFAKFFKFVDEGLKSNNAGVEAGANIATGVLKGLGDYLSGPGAATAVVLASKLFVNFGSYAAKAFGRILENNTKEFQVRQAINNLLVQNQGLNEKIKAGGLTQLQIQESILATLKGQSVEYARQGQIVAATKTLAAAGNIKLKGDNFVLSPKTKAVGHIPEMQEKIGAYAGGYMPGEVKQMSIPKLGNVYYNTAEKVKKFPGLSQPAIMPPQNSKAGINYKKDFSKAHGFNPYKSEGLIPNYANIGDKVKLIANAIARNEKVSAVRVLSDVKSANSTPHITLGVNREAGGKPVHSNELKDWQDIDPIELEGVISQGKGYHGAFLTPESKEKLLKHVGGSGMPETIAHHMTIGLGDFKANKGLVPNFASGLRMAAVKFGGKTYTGEIHHDAIMKAIRENPQLKGLNESQILSKLGAKKGFITNDGDFIDTEKAKANFGISMSTQIQPEENWWDTMSGGLVPNFARKLGEGSYGIFYDLERALSGKRVGKKEFKPSARDGDIRQEYKMSRLLENIKINPLFSFPKTFGSLERSSQRRRIGKEVVDGKTPRQMVGGDYSSFVDSGLRNLLLPFQDLASEELGSKHKIFVEDLSGHSQNTIINPEAEKILGKIIKYPPRANKLSNRLYERPELREQVANAIARKGGRLSFVDPGLFQDGGYANKGLIPNYAFKDIDNPLYVSDIMLENRGADEKNYYLREKEFLKKNGKMLGKTFGKFGGDKRELVGALKQAGQISPDRYYGPRDGYSGSMRSNTGILQDELASSIFRKQDSPQKQAHTTQLRINRLLGSKDFNPPKLEVTKQDVLNKISSPYSDGSFPSLSEFSYEREYIADNIIKRKLSPLQARIVSSANQQGRYNDKKLDIVSLFGYPDYYRSLKTNQLERVIRGESLVDIFNNPHKKEHVLFKPDEGLFKSNKEAIGFLQAVQNNELGGVNTVRGASHYFLKGTQFAPFADKIPANRTLIDFFARNANNEQFTKKRIAYGAAGQQKEYTYADLLQHVKPEYLTQGAKTSFPKVFEKAQEALAEKIRKEVEERTKNSNRTFPIVPHLSKETDRVKILKDERSLYEEGLRQGHCVGGYGDSCFGVNRDTGLPKSLIVSTGRATAELNPKIIGGKSTKLFSQSEELGEISNVFVGNFPRLRRDILGAKFSKKFDPDLAEYYLAGRKNIASKYLDFRKSRAGGSGKISSYQIQGANNQKPPEEEVELIRDFVRQNGLQPNFSGGYVPNYAYIPGISPLVGTDYLNPKRANEGLIPNFARRGFDPNIKLGNILGSGSYKDVYNVAGIQQDLFNTNKNLNPQEVVAAILKRRNIKDFEKQEQLFKNGAPVPQIYGYDDVLVPSRFRDRFGGIKGYNRRNAAIIEKVDPLSDDFAVQMGRDSRQHYGDVIRNVSGVLAQYLKEKGYIESSRKAFGFGGIQGDLTLRNLGVKKGFSKIQARDELTTISQLDPLSRLGAGDVKYIDRIFKNSGLSILDVGYLNPRRANNGLIPNFARFDTKVLEDITKQYGLHGKKLDIKARNGGQVRSALSLSEKTGIPAEELLGDKYFQDEFRRFVPANKGLVPNFSGLDKLHGLKLGIDRTFQRDTSHAIADVMRKGRLSQADLNDIAKFFQNPVLDKSRMLPNRYPTGKNKPGEEEIEYIVPSSDGSGMGIRMILAIDPKNPGKSRIITMTDKRGFAAGGLIPNFAKKIPNFNALSSAIARENKAGIPKSQIRVGQSSSLTSSANPMGLGVYNTKDEPLGLNQGIQRAVSMGLNPKTHGVPNFAPQYYSNINDPFPRQQGDTRLPGTKLLGLEESLGLESEIDKLKNQIKEGTRNQDSLNSAVQSLTKTYNLTDESAKKVGQRLNSSLKIFGGRSKPAQSSLSGLTGDLFGEQFVASGSGKQGEFLPITQQAELQNQLRIASLLKQSPQALGPSRERFDFEQLKLKFAAQDKASKSRVDYLREDEINRTRKSISPLGKISRENELTGLQSPELQQRLKQNREKRASKIIPISPNADVKYSYIPLTGPHEDKFKRVLTVASFKEQFGPSREQFDNIKFKERLARQERESVERPFREFQKFSLSGTQDLSRQELAKKIREQREAGRGLPEQARKEYLQRIRDFTKQESASREIAGLKTSAGRLGGIGYFFGQGKRDFQQLEKNNPDAARSITGSLQNKAFLASIVAPIIAGTLRERIGSDTKEQRGAGAIAGALGNAAGFAATGFALGGGLPGAVIGGVGGFLIELPNIIKSFSDTLPELQKRFGELQDVSQRTSAAFGEYISISEKLTDVFSGQATGLTNKDVENLKSGQRDALLKVGNLSDRNRIGSLVESGQLSKAREEISIINERDAQAAGATGLLANVKTLLPNIKGRRDLELKANAIESIGSSDESTAFFPSSLQKQLAEQRRSRVESAVSGELNNPKRLKQIENLISPVEQFSLGLTDKGGKSFFDNLLKNPELSKQLAGAKTGDFGKVFLDLSSSLNGFDNESIVKLSEAFTELEAKLGPEFRKRVNETFSEEGIKKLELSGKKFEAGTLQNIKSLLALNKTLFESQRKFESLGVSIEINGIKRISELASSLRIGEIQSQSKNNISLLRGGGEGLRGLFDFQQTQLSNRNRATESRSALSQNFAEESFGAISVTREKLTSDIKNNLTKLFPDEKTKLGEIINKITTNLDSEFEGIIKDLDGGDLDEQKAEQIIDKLKNKLGFFEKFAQLRGVPSGLQSALNTQSPLNEEGRKVFVQDFLKKNTQLSEQEISELTGLGVENLTSFINNSNEIIETYTGLTRQLSKSSEKYKTAAQKIASELEASDKIALESFNQNVKLLGEQRAVSLENTRRTGAFDVTQSRRQFDLSNSSLGKGFRERNETEAKRQFEGAAGGLIRGAIGKPEFAGLITDKTQISDIDKLLSKQEEVVRNAQISATFSGDSSEEANLKKEQDSLFAIQGLKEEIVNLENDSVETLRQANIEEEKNLRLLSGRLAEIQKINDGLIRTRDFSSITKKLGSDFSDSLSFTSDDFYKTLSDKNLQFAQEFKYTFKQGFAEAATGASRFSDVMTEIGKSLGKNILTKSSDLATDQVFGALLGSQSNITGGAGILSGLFKKNGGAIKKYAYGGFVNQGSGVKDDVPALLGGGEFVIKKSSTQKLGKGFLNALNNGGLIKKYANGGFNYNFANEFVGVGDKKRPTSGYANISPVLSDLALNDDNNPQNALRLSREKYFEDLAAYNAQNAQITKEFEKQQTTRRMTAYISAGINFAGSAFSQYNASNAAAKNAAFKDGQGPVSASYAKSLGYGRPLTQAEIRNTTFGIPSSPYARMMGGSIPRRYSMGGSVFGGDDIKDNVPAYLMGGEFVFNRNAADRLGKNNLEYMNKTGKIPGFANGGSVGGSSVYSPNSSSDSINSYFNELIAISAQIRDSLTSQATNSGAANSPQSQVAGITISNSIIVNVSENGVSSTTNTQSSSNGDKKGEGQDRQAQGKQFGEMVNSIVSAALVKESKVGGLLYNQFVKK